MLVVVYLTVQTGTLNRTSSVMNLIDGKREILDKYNVYILSVTAVFLFNRIVLYNHVLLSITFQSFRMAYCAPLSLNR